MNKSLISIIIPTYNRAFIIQETLNSILAQTYSNWECIIVDDGSLDNTEEIVAGYIGKDKRFQYHKRPENRKKGPNSCRNYGFELSKGNYVKWFDSDDLLEIDAFEKYIQFALTDFDVIICEIKYITLEGDLINKKHNYKSLNIIEDYLLGKITYYTFIPTWNRAFLNKQSEFFDETISNLDDWDFNLRMLYENPIIKYIHEPLIQYRCHENSLSQEIAKLNFIEIQSEFSAREKHLKLLSKNKKVNPVILREFIKDRYKFFFRQALVKKNEHHPYYLKMLVQNQIDLKDWRGLIKTIFGFMVFSVFNKGYKLLK